MFNVKRLDPDADVAVAMPAKSSSSSGAAGQKRKPTRALSSDSSSDSSDDDAPPRRAAPAPTPRKKPAASSSSSSSSSSSEDERPAPGKKAAPAPAPFVPVSNIMQAQYGFMLPSGLPPTAAEIAATEATRKAAAAALAAAAAAPKPAPSASAAAAAAAKPAAEKLQPLTTKQLKKLAPVAKLNAAQAAKLDAEELEAYRVARKAEKNQKKQLRSQQAPADKAADKAAKKQAAKTEAVDAATHATPAAPKEPKAPKPAPAPVVPSQSAATNPALRAAGLKKKDEAVRAMERAQRKRAREEAAGLIPVSTTTVEEEMAMAKKAEQSAHVSKLEDMRAARMAAVQERDEKDVLKVAMRDGPVATAAATASVAASSTSTPAAAAAPTAPTSAAAAAIAEPAASSADSVTAASAMHAKPLWMQRGRQVSPLASRPLEDFHFHPAITAQLRSQGIERFFATQSEVMPVLMKSYGVNDIACCAPTGSGKTLAYVLPIVQSLASRVVTRLRCIVLLPSRDLALQVFHVFQPFCAKLGLKVELVYGQHSFAMEKSRLVSSAPDAVTGKTTSLVDILVCTPGRLMDHLQAEATSAAEADIQGDSRLHYNFHLHDLQYLVIDEVDRLLNQTYSDWAPKVLANVYQQTPPVEALRASALDEEEGAANAGTSTSLIPASQRPGALSVDPTTDLVQLVERCWRRRFGPSSRSGGGSATGNATDQDASAHVPLQKLLFSATLTNNPAKLAALALHNPLFFTESTSLQKKFQIPTSLKQWVLNLPDEAQKPLVLIQLLLQLQAQAKAQAAKAAAKAAAAPAALTEGEGAASVSTTPASRAGSCQLLVFTSSVESTHRLCRLLEVFSQSAAGDANSPPPFAVAEFSSGLSQQVRSRILSRFRRGLVHIIVCSDAMARGMDLPHVDAVINYDVPMYIQTYVHRVGRTARAGASGSAYTLVKAIQFKNMRSMLHQADNSFYSKYPALPDPQTQGVMQGYQSALTALKLVLQMEKKGEQSAHMPLNDSLRVEIARQAASAAPLSSATDVDEALDQDMEDRKSAAAAAAAAATSNGGEEEAAAGGRPASKKAKKQGATSAYGDMADGVELDTSDSAPSAAAAPANGEVNFASKHAHKAKKIKLV